MFQFPYKLPLVFYTVDCISGGFITNFNTHAVDTCLHNDKFVCRT